jgi:hypothetical protein
MTVLQRVFVLVALTLAAACGTTTNSAGTPVPGGKPGNPCIAASAPAGCYTDSTGAQMPVSCPTDVSPATWVAGATCGAGTHCAMQGSTSACVANPVTVVQDTVSGGGDTSGDTSGVTGECIKSKCANEVNVCMTNPTCSKYITCMSACKDSACQNICATPLKNDATATKAVSALFQCSIDAQQTCQPVTTQCGDGKCEGSETKTSCPQDCASGADVTTSNDTGGGQDTSTGTAVCGDMTCAASEDASSCAVDCNTQYMGQAQCLAGACPDTWPACQKSTGCMFAVNCSVACNADPSCVAACQSDATDPAAKALLNCANTIPCWSE